MVHTIDIYAPGGTITLTEGSGGVHKITVHYYFANVVDIIIDYDDLSRERYYQVPCMYYTPPPD
jgi:hypothetical protein